jgi:hypothetical protein
MHAQHPPPIPNWARFEHEFISGAACTIPVQQVDLRVAFRSPSGVMRTACGFWDGGSIWRVRFPPDGIGRWTWRRFPDPPEAGLHDVAGSFACIPPWTRGGRFERHGPVVIANDGVRLEGFAGNHHLFVEPPAPISALKAGENTFATILGPGRSSDIHWPGVAVLIRYQRLRAVCRTARPCAPWRAPNP